MVQRKWDAVHEFIGAFSLYLKDSKLTRSATIIPIIMNDDALGDPMSFNAHPEHASWAEQPIPNCYPDSEIRSIKVILDVLVPKLSAAEASDFTVDFGLISCAFPEDLDAKDELSGLTLKEVLEIQKETTDRQTFPLFNGEKLPNGHTYVASMPGLTTTQVIEGVTFQSEILSDQRRYGKIKGLIKKCMPIGLRTLHLKSMNAQGTHKRITITFLPSNAKFINPHTFLGLLVAQRFMSPTAPTRDITLHQPSNQGDWTTDTEVLIYGFHVLYFERNPEFHMAKV